MFLVTFRLEYIYSFNILSFFLFHSKVIILTPQHFQTNHTTETGLSYQPSPKDIYNLEEAYNYKAKAMKPFKSENHCPPRF